MDLVLRICRPNGVGPLSHIRHLCAMAFWFQLRIRQSGSYSSARRALQIIIRHVTVQTAMLDDLPFTGLRDPCSRIREGPTSSLFSWPTPPAVSSTRTRRKCRLCSKMRYPLSSGNAGVCGSPLRVHQGYGHSSIIPISPSGNGSTTAAKTHASDHPSGL